MGKKHTQTHSGHRSASLLVLRACVNDVRKIEIGKSNIKNNRLISLKTLRATENTRAMRGAEGTTWDGIPSESPPQAGIFLSFTITKMGWESLSLMMVIMRWDGKHEEMH